MSLDLRHIPCPAGNACTAFQCIFGHEKDTAPAPASVDPASKESSGQGRADDEQPRKRARVDEGTAPAQNNCSPGDGLGQRADHSHKQRTTNHDIKFSNSQQASVPDDVHKAPRRAKDNSDAPSSKSSSVTATQKALPRPLKRPASTLEASSSPSTSARGGPSKTKPEYLNPRLLKSSPASHEVRLRFLRLLHAEYTRLNNELRKTARDRNEESLVLTDQELIVMALNFEHDIACSKAPVYPNVMKNNLIKFKRMYLEDWRQDRKNALAKIQVLKDVGDKQLHQPPDKTNTGLIPAQEVQILKLILTPIIELSAHGYVPKVPTDEVVQAARDGKEAAHGWEKCERCRQRFQVFPDRREEDGALTSGGTCMFHWGKTYIPSKPLGDTSRPTKRYMCCGESVGESAGCCTRDHHVYKVTSASTLATVLQFAETPSNDAVPADRAVSFDCEMCYTVHGMELVRLTAVSWPQGQVLLDVLVRPLGAILDLNSRFSGIWPEDMARAKLWTGDTPPPPPRGGRASSTGDMYIVSSPERARALFFWLIAPSTPLIGHGLENDLNAMRMVHPSIVDTVLLYPHPSRLPIRYGLKMLMQTHLDIKIQQETGPDVKGHDSAEDARAAGHLARLRVAREWERMQRSGWKFADGRLVQ